jgi:sulfite reductase alpha subunit-like flavoprotein
MGLAEDSFMSEAHLPTEELAQAAAYESGRAAGLAAIAEMQRVAPLEGNQKAWLLGFLQGAIDAAGQYASQTTRVSAASSLQPESLTPAEPAPSSARHQVRISAIETPGADPLQWQSVAFEPDDSLVHYSPGSSLALWPTNDAEEVRRILRTLGVSAQLLVPTETGPGPAWQVLLERVDISATGNTALHLLAEYSRSSSEAGSLIALADGPAGNSRSLLALLRRFPSSRPPIERLLTSLDPLKPSYVPIASSCLERSKPLLAALHSGASASVWGHVSAAIRSRLRVGEWLSVSVDEHQFPAPLRADDLDPVIIIADGPSVALARAFAAERRERQAKGRTWVIVAGTESVHFPFARTLAAWQRAGSLSRFDIALGSDPSATLHTLDEHEENLWRWLVDHSRCYLVSSRPALRTTVTGWFSALLARRYRLSDTDSAQRLLELSQSGRWAVLPADNAVGLAQPDPSQRNGTDFTHVSEAQSKL